MGALESRDGHEAICSVHGGRYEILFMRQPASAPPPPIVAYSLAGNAACAQHPGTPADYACRDCGTPICGVCSFDQPDGSHLCPNCAQRRTVFGTPAAPVAPIFPAGVHCVQHPHLAATAQCKSCGGFMCDTCKFELPGGIVICPTCAANPRTSLTGKQKLKLIGSYAAAIWCTLVMGAMFAGAFRSLAKDPGGEQALGFLLMIILLAPAIAGVSLGVASMRRHATPISVWIATIWNSVILGGFLLLCIVGLMSK